MFQCRVTFVSRVLNSISHYDFPVNPGNEVVPWSTRGFSFQRLNEAQSITL